MNAIVKMREWSTLLFLGIFMCMCLFSCSDDSDKVDSILDQKVEAPENPSKEFKFYKGDNLKWSFKVLPTSDPEKTIITLNSETAQVNGFGNFYYQKISEKEATVSCFFMTRIAIGGNLVGQWNQYEIKLTFISAYHGKFEGKILSSPEDKTGKAISGMFVYNSDLELEDILKLYEEEQGEGKAQLNWDLLVEKTWKYQVNESNYLTYYFKTNGSYQWMIHTDETQNGSGNYTINKEENILSLKDLGDYEILALSDSLLTLVEVGLDKKQARTFVAVENATDVGISLSEPIVSIENTKAKVKGSVLSDIQLDATGVCWSLTPSPKISDNCSYSSAGPVVNATFQVAKGYTYYVRLFAKYNGAVYYGDEVKFTVPGEKVEHIIMKQTYWAPGELKFQLELPPYKMGKYGICWSTQPSPKITDNYLAEKEASGSLNQVDEWELKNLSRGTKYYVRAYHINGSEIIYYPDEFVVQTLGADTNIALDLDYSNSNFQKGDEPSWVMGTLKYLTYKLSLKGFNPKEYKVRLFFNNKSSAHSDDRKYYGNIDDTFYIKGPVDSYSKYVSQIFLYSYVSGRKSSGSYFLVEVSDLSDNLIAKSFFYCAWSYTKFVYNPLPMNTHFLDESNTESVLDECLNMK